MKLLYTLINKFSLPIQNKYTQINPRSIDPKIYENSWMNEIDILTNIPKIYPDAVGYSDINRVRDIVELLSDYRYVNISFLSFVIILMHHQQFEYSSERSEEYSTINDLIDLVPIYMRKESINRSMFRKYLSILEQLNIVKCTTTNESHYILINSREITMVMIHLVLFQCALQDTSIKEIHLREHYLIDNTHKSKEPDHFTVENSIPEMKTNLFTAILQSKSIRSNICKIVKNTGSTSVHYTDLSTRIDDTKLLRRFRSFTIATNSTNDEDQWIDLSLVYGLYHIVWYYLVS